MQIKVNEISIKYQGNFEISQAPKITSSESAAAILYNHWNKDQIGLQECFKVILLNNANKVKGIYEVSKGGITGTLVNIRILLAVILKSLTVSVIMPTITHQERFAPAPQTEKLLQKFKQPAGILILSSSIT